MLTKADDYPVHQTAEPIAHAGTDRNFYDRYFFNGYNADGSVFFASALGVYPHLNIMDASFCVIREGVQHNLRASKILYGERMDTKVGPIGVDVVEPLHRLSITVGDNDHGVRAELVFTSRTNPIEEPRFTYRIGPRTVMDYTRLTQNGSWEGWIEVDGDRIDISAAKCMGTRDRSWGIRNVGASDSQAVAPAPDPQFFWLWAPLNFPDRITLYHLNADGDGHAWNTNAVVCATGDSAPEEMDRCRSVVTLRSGSRHAQTAALSFETREGEAISIELSPKFNFYMSGLGYMHPSWGHGMLKGELSVSYDTIDLARANESEYLHLHVQAFVSAKMTLPDGQVLEGCGVLEQLMLGRYDPLGLTGLLDPTD